LKSMKKNQMQDLSFSMNSDTCTFLLAVTVLRVTLCLSYLSKRFLQRLVKFSAIKLYLDCIGWHFGVFEIGDASSNDAVIC
jgi:hypothetical protein